MNTNTTQERRPMPTAEEYRAAMRELSRLGWARLSRESREVINRWEGR